MADIILPYSHLLIWLGISSAVVMLVGILSLPWLVGLIPADFLTNHHEFVMKRRSAGWLAFLLRNIVGYFLLLAGVIMLVLPGQGLLTILIGLLLMDYPGKHALEVRLLSNDKVLSSINWLRSKRGYPPLHRKIEHQNNNKR